MEKYKLKEIKEDIKLLLGTKYDDLFKPRIKSRGIKYSILNKVNDINNINGIVKAKVLGTQEYDVSIKFNKETIKEVSCTCPYHEKSTYCKHIYAVLYELSKKDKEETRKRYKEYVLYNAKIVNDFFIEVNSIIKHNKKNFNDEFFDMYSNIYYDLEGKYTDLKLDKKELSQLNDYLNIIKQDYEKLEEIYNQVLKLKDIDLDIDDINEKDIDNLDKVDINEKNIDSLDNEDIYEESDDSLIRILDTYIENTPLEVLEKVSEDNIKNGRDNRIIEKAIKNKKKKSIKENKQSIFAGINSFFSLFTSSSKNTNNNSSYSSIEEEEIAKGNYEPYQFEEEDLEEDDYYYEDDLD